MNPQEAIRTLDNYVSQLMNRSTAEQPAWNIELSRGGMPNKWNYIDGCMITALLALHDITHEDRYLTFADSFVDWFVQPDGQIRTYAIKEYNIDNVSPARNLLTLHALTGKEKYLSAAKRVRRQLDEMPRTKAGNFWHKQIYPWQVWLDGLYMAQPFYMRYETEHNRMRGCADSFHQFENVYQLMRRPDGLYCHGYDESRQMYWANPETGQSPNCWLRALGWFSAALVDTLEHLDEQFYFEYRYLQRMLRELIDAILPWQHEGGMFHQIIDQPNADGNYLETSGTALIAYAVLKAVRMKLLPASYGLPARRAFDGIAERYLDIDAQGEMSLGGICLVAGLGGAEHRDGSLAYYFSEPVVQNEAKGIAPLLLAYCEILRQA